MKRLLSLLVTGSLLVTPVLAVQTDVEASFPAVREPAAFADVANGSWYTNAAGLCYVTGLLNGTGNGNFSPSRSVTIGEAAALAARIHHILNGGDGSFAFQLSDATRDYENYTADRSHLSPGAAPGGAGRSP